MFAFAADAVGRSALSPWRSACSPSPRDTWRRNTNVSGVDKLLFTNVGMLLKCTVVQALLRHPRRPTSAVIPASIFKRKIQRVKGSSNWTRDLLRVSRVFFLILVGCGGLEWIWDCCAVRNIVSQSLLFVSEDFLFLHCHSSPQRSSNTFTFVPSYLISLPLLSSPFPPMVWSRSVFLPLAASISWRRVSSMVDCVLPPLQFHWLSVRCVYSHCIAPMLNSMFCHFKALLGRMGKCHRIWLSFDCEKKEVRSADHSWSLHVAHALIKDFFCMRLWRFVTRLEKKKKRSRHVACVRGPASSPAAALSI